MGIPLLRLDPTLLEFDQDQGVTDRLQSLAYSIITALATYPHYVVVEGYPAVQDRTNIMHVAHAIMELDARILMASGRSGESETLPSTLSKKTNQKVSFTKVHVNSAKARTGDGVTQYSRTHLPLSPHTDSSYMPRPHELVAFQCIVSAESGGRSIMIPIADLLKQLDPDVIDRLRSPVYPFRRQNVPILIGTPGQERIRYYRAQLDRSSGEDPSALSDHYWDAVEALDIALQQTERFDCFDLHPGQIVFMHNQKVLHGRTGFSLESDRLLYRIRLHVNCLAGEPIAQSEPLGHSLGPPLHPSRQPNNSIGQPIATDAVNQEQAIAHLVIGEKLAQLGNLEDAIKHYRHASQLAPGNIDILNAYGEFMLYVGQFAEATAVFCQCLKIEPNHYNSGLAMSSIFHAHGKENAAQPLLQHTIQQNPCVLEQPLASQKHNVMRMRAFDDSVYSIVQKADGFYKHLLRGGHFSVEALVNQDCYNLWVLNIYGDNIDDLDFFPKTDILINTIACPDLKRSSLLVAARFCSRYPNIPVINDPRLVLQTTRERNALRLNLIPGVQFPKTERLMWDGHSAQNMVKEIWGLGFTYPIIIRRVGSQTGSSVALANNNLEVCGYFEQSWPGQDYYVIQFHNYINSKNLFNKCRVFFIDGQLYPVANLFHNEWNVHSGDRYQVMDKTSWTQDKEKEFLEDPVSYFGNNNIDKLYQVYKLIGLDFFGIDFTILQDGILFIFELNAAMRHNFDHAANFPYTKPYLTQISSAFNVMLEQRMA
ncbi:MAG: TauD/TfdA family dioxygenase [Cyanobacteria bacterium P01_F01_bin.150]